MDIWLVVFIGVVQGITEWFPVSSSGHLVIIQIFNSLLLVGFTLLVTGVWLSTLEILSTPLKNVITAVNIGGFLMVFIIGILTIKFLLDVIKRGKFFLFSIYSGLLSSAVIIISLVG